MNDQLTSENELIAHRRWFHQHPEVGLHLPATQKYVVDILSDAGIEIHAGVRQSSVAAVVRGGRVNRLDGEPVPTLLVRTDMDALPMAEETGLEWSATGSSMHACGHDCHLAIVLTAALEVQRHAADLEADCVFFFQPGEEGHGGAQLALEEGLLDVSGSHVQAVLGLHVLAHLLAPGEVASRPGSLMSGSTLVDVRVRGVGGHGSSPHLGHSALTAATAFVREVDAAMHQQVDMFDPAVMTFGILRAGEARNVIPGDARISGVMRTFAAEAEQRVRALLERVARGTEIIHGVDIEVHLHQDTIPVISDGAELDFMEEVLLGRGVGLSRLDRPISISEDFSWILAQVPGVFLLVGAGVSDEAGLPANHSPRAQFSDDVLLPSVGIVVDWVRKRAARLNAEP